MIIQFGNTHEIGPPYTWPTGLMVTHRWAFFLAASDPDIIESVDLRVPDIFGHYRFVELRRPPYLEGSLAFGESSIIIFITLREGWEWLSPGAVNSPSKPRRVMDLLPVEWPLDFRRGGAQVVITEEFREIEDTDTILSDLPALFGEIGSLSDGEEA